MKKLFTLLALTFSSIMLAQVATFDSAAASNALTAIEKSTETINKLDELRESTEKALNLVTTVNSSISTGVQVKNIFKYQADIIQNIDKIRRQVSRVDSSRRVGSYNKMVLNYISMTNDLMLKTSSVINTGVLNMNDYERINTLSDIEEKLRVLASSSARLSDKIR